WPVGQWEEKLGGVAVAGGPQAGFEQAEDEQGGQRREGRPQRPLPPAGKPRRRGLRRERGGGGRARALHGVDPVVRNTGSPDSTGAGAAASRTAFAVTCAHVSIRLAYY